jgi:hypothetical protein
LVYLLGLEALRTAVESARFVLLVCVKPLTVAALPHPSLSSVTNGRRASKMRHPAGSISLHNEGCT